MGVTGEFSLEFLNTFFKGWIPREFAGSTFEAALKEEEICRRTSGETAGKSSGEISGKIFGSNPRKAS